MADREMTGTMMLLPPAKHLCQTCAHDHAPDQPHNATTLYYQTAFNMQHGRAPTWADAWEHCAAEVQGRWREALIEMGIDVDAGQVFKPEAAGS